MKRKGQTKESFELIHPHNIYAEKEFKVKHRTVQEFVEDLLSNGRTSKQILAVAKNTRWDGGIEEIKDIIRRFFKKFKKLSQITSKKDDNII